MRRAPFRDVGQEAGSFCRLGTSEAAPRTDETCLKPPELSRTPGAPYRQQPRTFTPRNGFKNLAHLYRPEALKKTRAVSRLIESFWDSQERSNRDSRWMLDKEAGVHGEALFERST